MHTAYDARFSRSFIDEGQGRGGRTLFASPNTPTHVKISHQNIGAHGGITQREEQVGETTNGGTTAGRTAVQRKADRMHPGITTTAII